MRKKMINEYDGVLLGVDIIFYVIFIVIGSILLEFQNINYNEINSSFGKVDKVSGV